MTPEPYSAAWLQRHSDLSLFDHDVAEAGLSLYFEADKSLMRLLGGVLGSLPLTRDQLILWHGEAWVEAYEERAAAQRDENRPLAEIDHAYNRDNDR